jgi:hypothetical protein
LKELRAREKAEQAIFGSRRIVTDTPETLTYLLSYPIL